MRNIIYRLYPLLIILAFGCKQDNEVDPVEEPKAGDLIDYELVNSYDENEIQNIVDLAGFGQFSSLFSESVDLYRINYYTNFKGELIECSGLISFPNDNDTYPKLVFNHGTLFYHGEAPSKKPIPFEFLFSAAGYMSIVPDYIGFGASEQFLHPYYVREPIAAAVVDMIKASSDFTDELELSINDQLFLAGYSEGGYVTLATQRAIELDSESDLEVTASAAGAGGYNLKGVMNKIIENDTFASPNYLAYIIQAYKETLDWEEPLNTFFKDPYADQIPTLIDGSKGGGYINDQLSYTINELFKDPFLETLKNDTEDLLLPALQQNSLVDWVPQSPTRMYHGTKDEIVPFKDSEETFTHFSEQGAPDLEFYEIVDGTHGTSFQPMLINVATWFESMKQD